MSSSEEAKAPTYKYEGKAATTYTKEEVARRDGGFKLRALSKEEGKLNDELKSGASSQRSSEISKRVAEIQTEKKQCLKEAWIVLHGMVYDTTSFLNSHPGGPESIINHAGSDATREFEDIYHSANARESLRELLVGRLDTFKGSPTLVYEQGSSGSQSNSMIFALFPVIVALLAVIYYFGFGK